MLDKNQPQPKMEEERASIKGTTSIHEAAKGGVGGRIGAKSDGDMREAIIDGDGHRGKSRTRGDSTGSKRFDNDHNKAGAFECGGVGFGGGSGDASRL